MTTCIEEMVCPLVSVAVITYNSAATVIETLDSIKRQTYKNIELIISDDASSDNTVDLCEKWTHNNEKRFINVKIITVQKNSGVSANMNRAEYDCSGEWVKCIAGDDILFDDCIEANVKFVSSDTSARFVFSRIHAFGASEEVNEYWNSNIFNYQLIQKSSVEQLDQLLFRDNYIPAATFFYHRKTMISLKITNDERIPLLEDFPKWINILKKGGIFSFLDKETVYYRIHEGSLSTGIKSIAFEKSNRLFFIYYLFWPRFKRDPSMSLIREYYHAKIFTNQLDLLTIIYLFVRNCRRLCIRLIKKLNIFI